MHGRPGTRAARFVSVADSNSMLYAGYTLLWTVVAPVLALVLVVRGRHRALLRRFWPEAPPSTSAPQFASGSIWVHACSVGEVRTALPIANALRQRFPGAPLVITVSTVTGRALALESFQGIASVTWLPFDHPWLTRRFVRRLAPRLLLILETELWPALIRECAAAGVPVAIVNGRISDKHLARYRRILPLMRTFVPRISAAGVQSETYRGRFIEFGLDAGRILVTGNTKFDGAPEPIPNESLSALRAQCGFGADDRVVVFGSTRPGDEARAASCWRELRGAYPSLRFVIAPRHLDRADEAAAAFGEGVARRSAGVYRSNARILLVDTLGELIHFYAMSDVAVIGGSFSPEVQGHNPIEPAALGVPVLFGPRMRNFADAAELLVSGGGARRVADDDELVKNLRALLNDHSTRVEMGQRARNVVVENRGAIARTLDFLSPLFTNESAPTDIANVQS